MQVQIRDNLDEEVVLGLLEQFLKNGEISIRKLKLNRSKDRGINKPIKVEKPYSNAFMRDLRKMIYEVYCSCSYDIINEKYLDEIKSIGIKNIRDFIYYKDFDSRTRDFLDRVYSSSYDIYTGDFEGPGTAIGGSNTRLIKFDEQPSMYRFYFNMPKTPDSVDFINEYIKLCQDEGISYRMKPFQQKSSDTRDVTILYSSVEDFEIKKNILFKLYNDYKDKVEFGTPPEACARIDGTFIGVCHNGRYRAANGFAYNLETYNDYIDSLFKTALIINFSPILLNSKSIEDTTKKKIRSLLNYRESYFDTPGIYLSAPSSIFVDDGIRKEIEKFLATSENKKINKKLIFEWMKKIHNIRNGFDIKENTSIALDTWYTRDPLLLEKLNYKKVGKK